MTLIITPQQAAAPPANRPRARVTVWLIAAGWLVQVAIRLLLSWHAKAPAAFDDEGGYLLAARWLAGGPGADLSSATFYQAGYPLLIAPVFWITHDPSTAYRLVLLVGALAGALVFPLSVRILCRLGIGPLPAYALGFAVALLPANVFYSGWALTDAILPAVVCCWLVALIDFADTGRITAGCAASLSAAYAYAVHSRGVVILLVHVGVLLVLLVRRYTPVRHALYAAGVTVVGAVAANRLNAWVLSALYPDGARDLGSVLRSRLTSAGGILRILSGACGQLWYVTVATWGLAGLGLVGITAVAASRSADRSLRLLSGAVLATTIGIAVASTAALPDEHRIGNYAYGRYLACLAVPLTLAGIAMLLRARRRRVMGGALATAALIAGTALAVTAYAGGRLHGYNFVAFDFPETSFLTRKAHALDMPAASLAASGLVICAILLRRYPPALAALALGVDLGFAVNMVEPGADRPYAAARPALVGGGVEATRDVRRRALIALRYRVSWTQVRWLSPAGPRPGTCTVIVGWTTGPASGSWPGHPQEWSPQDGDRSAGWATWRRAGCGDKVTRLALSRVRWWRAGGAE